MEERENTTAVLESHFIDDNIEVQVGEGCSRLRWEPSLLAPVLDQGFVISPKLYLFLPYPGHICQYRTLSHTCHMEAGISGCGSH